MKPYIEELRSSESPIILSFDDSIKAKPYTDESVLICWHWDHVFQRSVKGVNFMTVMADVQGMRLPCAVEFIRKNTWKTDSKTGKKKRASSLTKNELFRQMVSQCWKNFTFNYLVCDNWFSSTENMQMVKQGIGSQFIMAIKLSRKVALG